ncbi:SDR family NAD(P)-dependent oxidoreductase [Nocardia sp. CDC159]|uniref:SDR family NAD(P)-dependent oxidoreductase n=1 Tax=Nocardia pulmonis TaxID=2951408 RepID=A0A9X2J390_9NOCA|nr:MULTISPECIES: type I polyketide synthase [Nocardia]MCM6778856.1 SDR family NAD(P)-dependent oxidoreductase [Nocardia pulmonis]MCM6791745.1 SDR family NAD(P)-dependent oxidoreductase [Nocardia sp. CDC159]
MSDIAIVGIGCRYAGGIDSPESFWDFVVNKRDGVREIPPERWNWRRYYDPDRRAPGRMYTKRAAFMTGDPWAFDPDFFGISPREAAAMDPQQRLVLEVTWEAFDDAGIAGRTAGAPLGVYVGAFTLDQLGVSVGGPALPHVDMHTAAGASYTMISNRIAYALNLVGPAITVDTACSSSLVALHLACQAIDNGDCEIAVAGGVTVLAEPEPFVSMCKGGFLAADGRSKPFDASADGYGRGEGVGMVVLKKLADAERDGDRVYAVIKATNSNQDGRTTAITVPNADAQEALAKAVIRRAGIEPHEVTYIEAHGTGTPVGDPLELRAIGHAYGAVPGRTTPVGVGSVKAQLGHTEAASGIASVIKSALAVSKRTIAPQGWIDTPNPDIPFEELGIRLQLEVEQVGPEVDRVTIAVNGFGYGGTNAHAILQEYTGPRPAPRKPEHPGVLPISARSEQAVRDLARGFAERIADGADPGRLTEAAWTRRAHHPFRAGITFGDDTELVRNLVDFAGGAGRVSRVIARKAPEPVFVFTGMGPQWWAMARELLTAGGAFAAEAERIDTEFRAIAGWSIVEELLRPEEESRVTTTAVAQPANFLVQVSLVALLAELGVHPAAIVGHSVGEVSAAYVTGMLSLHDALLVGYHRARLQATTAGSGGMLAVGIGLAAAQALIEGDNRVDVAAVNSPSAVTLAGDVGRLDEIAETLTARGIFARRLQVEVPYHSHLMDPILDELRTVLADLRLSAPRIPLYSTVTGAPVTTGDWDAEYWCANVRQSVRFADAVTELVRAGHRVFLEVGPHPVLGANIREILIAAGESGTTVATLNRKQSDAESVRQSVAGLYAAGVLDIDALFAELPTPTPHLDLPRYPWQRTHLRNDLPIHRLRRHGAPDTLPMLGDQQPDETASWQLELSNETLPWLADHVVGGSRILPGAAYLDAALSVAALRTESTRVAVEQVRFVAPLVIDDGETPIMRFDLEESTRRFTIRSRGLAGSVWTINAMGRLVEGVYERAKVDVPDDDSMVEIDPAEFYAQLATHGLDYGPAFRRAISIRVSGGTVVARLDGTIARQTRHPAHPAVVDASLQSVAALLAGAGSTGDGAMVPVAVRAMRLLAPLPEEVTVVARVDTTGEPTADIDLLDADHHVCVQIRGLRFGSIAPRPGPMQRMVDFFYEDRWEMRDPVESAALPATDGLHTVVAVMAPASTVIAERIAAVTATGRASSELFVIGDPDRADLEDELTQRIRRARGRAGVERLHLVVVAGDDYDEMDSLWTLRRIALTAEHVLDAWLAEHGAEMELLGDGTYYASLITEHARTHPDGEAAPNPSHAALAGARRALLNEQTRLRWRLIDADGEVADADLAAELTIPGAFTHDHADEVFLHNGIRWVTVVGRTLQERLDALDEARPLTDREADFRLELPRNKTFAKLGWRRGERRAPGPGEVEVRMTAIGLNYKDSLRVIGVLGDRELGDTFFGTEPGMEGAGVIVRLGEGVTGFRVGDEVGLACRGMIGRFNTLAEDLVWRVGEGFEPGRCSSSTSFVAAEYALLELARVRPGETVLVHGAAGGVGSAAVQIAKLHGARVIGTASTDERRAYVLEQGADHALGSRSLNFVDEVLALTNGRGADVVISSAPGEILVQNFDAVAEFGRIVEVGKADIYFGGVLELRHFDKNVAYFSFDLDRMMKLRQQEVFEYTKAVNGRIDDGTYRALPFEMYGTAEVARAFEEVARSSRIGRVALDLDEDAPLVRPRIPDVVIDSGARYLITGGFGGFGLAVGRWLVDKGARRLTLLGRGGPATEEARRQLAVWEQQGVAITTELVDVADAEAVAAVVARAHTREHPLRGIFHTAGAVDDKRIGAMDRGSLAKVFRPKLIGARALWEGVVAAGARLDQFVLFSSGSAIFGGIGHYSYTAANIAVNAYAEALARQGVNALAVGWGHMAGAGMAAADENLARYLVNTGFDTIEMDDGPLYLEQALRLGVTRVDIFPISWARVAATGPQLALTGRIEAMIAAAAQNDSAASRLRAELAALDETKRREVVAHMLAEQLAAVMGVAAESIDLTVPLPELGLDSLMAVEFGSLVTQTLGVDLISLKLGRSFSLEQAGAIAAEAIVEGSGSLGLSSAEEVAA